MARVVSTIAFDMSSMQNIFEFGKLRGDFGSGRFFDDYSYGFYDYDTGDTYTDLFSFYYGTTVNPPEPYNPRELTMLGDGFVFLRDPSAACGVLANPDWQFACLAEMRLTGGTVSRLSLSQWTNNFSSWGEAWYITDFDYSASALDRAVRTTSTRDDAAVLRQILSGDDEFTLSDGNDIAYGYDGHDFMYGNGGYDFLDGGRGDDYLFGGDGGGILYGQLGNDVLVGGADSDTLYGGRDDDILEGGKGDDWLYGELGRDLLGGGAGFDVINGGNGNDVISGGEGRDMLLGGWGVDIIHGDGDDDTLYGGGGGDELWGDGDPTETGNDQLYGEDGSDKLYGGDGQDELFGGAGHDRMDGGAGDDILEGGAGNDTLLGGEGSDRLTGGVGRDQLTGGAGGDRFIFLSTAESTNPARDRITDFNAAEGDRIDLAAIDADGGSAGTNDAFDFIGASSFGGTAGELRAFKVGRTGDRYRVEGDTNGDGVADFSLDVTSGAALTGSDFILGYA